MPGPIHGVEIIAMNTVDDIFQQRVLMPVDRRGADSFE